MPSVCYPAGMGLGSGQIALDTDLLDLAQASSAKPIGRISASATQAVPITTQTAFLMGAEDYDTHNFHSTSVNSSRITPTIAGYYRFAGVSFWAAQTGTTLQQVVFRKNGTTNLPPAWRALGETAGTWSSGAVVLTQPFNGTTDYIELTAILGVAITTALSVQFATTIEWEYVRDL